MSAWWFISVPHLGQVMFASFNRARGQCERPWRSVLAIQTARRGTSRCAAGRTCRAVSGVVERVPTLVKFDVRRSPTRPSSRITNQVLDDGAPPKQAAETPTIPTALSRTPCRFVSSTCFRAGRVAVVVLGSDDHERIRPVHRLRQPGSFADSPASSTGIESFAMSWAPFTTGTLPELRSHQRGGMYAHPALPGLPSSAGMKSGRMPALSPDGGKRFSNASGDEGPRRSARGAPLPRPARRARSVGNSSPILGSASSA